MQSQALMILMFDLFTYGFVLKAVLGGILIAIACSLIGVFLVLKRLSLFGDGLAHVAFGGVAIGFLLGIDPFISALIFTSIGALSVGKILEKAKIYGDSATALVLSVGMSIAILIIGVSKGFNVNLFSFLFGSILTLSNSDLTIIFGICLVVVSYVILNFKNLLLYAFSPDQIMVGSKIKSVSFVLSLLTAFIVVISMRAVGILLVSALIVIPSLTALSISRSFKSALILSVFFGIISVLVGIIVSVIFDLPSGALIVLSSFLIFIFSNVFKSFGS
jgi:zinc transport system permease protein